MVTNIMTLINSIFFTAFAEALSNVVNLLSADLLDMEKKIKSKQETYTLLSFFQEISSWLNIIKSFGTFYDSSVAENFKKSNWEKAIILLSALDQAVNTCHEPRLFSLFVDLHLKTMAPYFR